MSPRYRQSFDARRHEGLRGERVIDWRAKDDDVEGQITEALLCSEMWSTTHDRRSQNAHPHPPPDGHALPSARSSNTPGDGFQCF
jgi:hypothetical protein